MAVGASAASGPTDRLSHTPTGAPIQAVRHPGAPEQPEPPPVPDDYGPDPSTPFTRALALPRGQRPPVSELRKLLGPDGRRPPNPDAPLVEDWIVIPPTTPARYVTGGSALNVPDPLGRAGGDWHPCWSYLREADAPRRVATPSTEDEENNPARRHVWIHFLGAERLLDLRPGLAEIAHPQADEAAPIWGASHERAPCACRTALHRRKQERNGDATCPR